MKTAFGYSRVSGRGQLKGDGLRRQSKAIESYALQHDIKLLKVFEEGGVSGTLDEAHRPAFQEMVTDILKNGTRTIIVEGLDRLARAYAVQEQLLVYLASKGITLINARTGEDVTAAITADPMKKAIVQIQGVFAELEKGLLTKKLRKARDAKREANGKCEGRKGLHESPEGLEIIAKVKSMRRKPRKGRRKSYATIAHELNEQGHKTMTGKPWTQFNVQNIVKRH